MRQKTGHIAAGRHQRRDEVRAFVRSYMKASQGRPPTAREIQAGTGLRSLQHVHTVLGELESDGLIRRARFGRTRQIGIVGARYLLPDEAEPERRGAL